MTASPRIHEEYGRQILSMVAGATFDALGEDTLIDYGAGRRSQVTGVIDGSIVVKVESGTPKEIRNGVLDLICHRLPKKFLIIIPVHTSNPEIAATQCQNIMSRFLPFGDFRVLVVAGSGKDPRPDQDSELVRSAIKDLGLTYETKRIGVGSDVKLRRHTECRVQIETELFIEALKRMKVHLKGRGKLYIKILATTDASELILELEGRSRFAGIQTTVRASGSWPRDISVRVSSLSGLVVRPPDSATLNIEVYGRKFRIGNWSCPVATPESGTA